MPRRTLCLLLAALLHAPLLAGCGPDGGAAGADLESITVWETYNAEEHVVFADLARDFEREHERRTGRRAAVRVERVPYEGLLPKLKYAAITHTTPDVCRVDNAWVLTLAYGKAIVPLDTLAGFGTTVDEEAARYVPAAIANDILEAPDDNGASWSRHLYGVPDQTNCVALFWNRELFRKSADGLRRAGLDPNRAPATWDEFVRYAKVLTVPERRQFGFGMFATLWWIMPFLNTYGAEFTRQVDGRTVCAFGDPPAAQALEFFVSLFREHGVEAGAWQTGAINPEQGFLNGKYAMILTGPWNLTRFEGLDFGVALIPAGPAGTSSNVGGSNMVVFRSSRRPDLALAFLRWFTSTETQLRWSRQLGQIPVNQDAFETAAAAATGTHLGVFFEQLRTARPLRQVPRMDQIEDRVVNPMIELALKGQSSPTVLLQNACRQVDEEYLSIVNAR